MDESYRYCPRCRAEYRPGFEICTDCGVDLVDELPAETPVEDPDLEALQSWVGTDPMEVYVTTSEVHAHIVRSALVSAGIPSIVWASAHGGYYGHSMRLNPFPHRVMIHKDDEAEARELLAAQFPDEAGE